jgi:hypothetical protein
MLHGATQIASVALGSSIPSTSSAPASRWPASADEFVEALCRLFDHLTRINCIPTTARLVLFMEGSHNSSLREALSRGREALESVVVVALARLGAHDPATAATTVAACFEVLLLHRIARHDETDPRPAFELVVRAALA